MVRGGVTPRKHRIFVGVLILAVISLIMPGGVTTAQAAPMDWDTLTQQVGALTSGESTLTIDSDLTLTSESNPMVVPSGVSVTLGGAGSVTGLNAPAIQVEAGGTLNLAGPSFTKVQFDVAGDLNFTAGSIHDSDPAGSVIFVNGGNFTMGGTADFSNNTTPEDKVANALTPEGVDANKLAPITVYNGTATISGGTINGNQGLLKGGALGIWGSAEKAATLNIKGGEIAENSVQHSRFYGYGGAIYAQNTDVNISGGNIHENFTEYGGAMAVEDGSLNITSGNLQGNKRSEYSGAGGALYLNRVKTNVSGGTFKGNIGSDQGGGTIQITNSDFHITGGDFTENECLYWGGAINVVGGTVTIDGGSFVGNTASASGGALSLSGGTERYDGAQGVINAGYFANNTAKGFYGGGATYNDNNSKLTINDALIRNNSIKDARILSVGGHPVSAQGGGVWNCPFGTSVLNITCGVAIFDNDAYNAGSDGSFKGAGDDFLGATTHRFNEPTPVQGQPIKISERMLGGGERVWFQDGSVYGIRTNWNEARQLPRYQEGGENTRIPYNTEIKDHIAFKSVPSDDSKKLAEKLARVVVENNVASWNGFSGGGIGNNGLLTFGEPEKWEVVVKKDWQGDDPASRPTEVALDVLVGGFKVDEITLSADNEWTAKLENFPNPATLTDAQTGEKLPITFKENGMDEYTLVISDESADENTKIYTISLVNKMTTEVSVNKLWAESAGSCEQPDSVQVELLANGKPSGNTLELNADNSWTAKFSDLPKYDDGKIVDYSVSEIAVKNYKSVVSGDAEHDFTVTNTCTRPKRLPRTGEAGSLAGAGSLVPTLTGTKVSPSQSSFEPVKVADRT